MFTGIDEVIDTNRAARRASLSQLNGEFASKGLYRSGPRIREVAQRLGQHYEALAHQMLDMASEQPDPVAATKGILDRLRQEYEQFRTELIDVVTEVAGGEAAMRAALGILDEARAQVESDAAKSIEDAEYAASGFPAVLETEDGDGITTEDGEPIELEGRVRVTEDGDRRVTEDGDNRVTEDGSYEVTSDGDYIVTEDGDRILVEDDTPPTIAAASASASGVGSANAVGEAVWREPPTPQQAAQLRERLSSASWTGIEQRIAAMPGSIEKVGSLIAQLDRAVEQCGLTNYEQQKAKALTGALMKLVSSPQPEWQLIVNVLNSPVLSALWRVKEISMVLAALVYWLVGNP